MRDLNKGLDDKNYDTKVSATKTNYDGDGFCGVTSKNYPEINDVKPSVKTNLVPDFFKSCPSEAEAGRIRGLYPLK
jgi:hypothetical protein